MIKNLSGNGMSLEAKLLILSTRIHGNGLKGRGIITLSISCLMIQMANAKYST